MNPATAPLGLLAELTHRCPLACPYCSNPLALEARGTELGTEEWARVLHQAAALGVLQVHLSGGEPAARQDLVAIVAAARAAGLYTNLITSALGLNDKRLAALQAAGLDHVQLSLQDSQEAPADATAGHAGAHRRKLTFAREVAARNMALTVNVVVHRGNIAHIPELVALAAELGAGRVEIAHAQYHGWAALNRAALLPSPEQVRQALRDVAAMEAAFAGRLVIDHVLPDHFARRPKPCMGGWARRSLNVTPSGQVMPCHAAATIPGMNFWSVRERGLAEIWEYSPAFEAFRGTDWMREPCRSCDQRAVDFGGCRCQALAFTGDAANADPACELSPHHLDFVTVARQSGAAPRAVATARR